MASWTPPHDDVSINRPRIEEKVKGAYFLTAIPATTDYVLHSPHGASYRLEAAEAVRLQVAGVPFRARGEAA